MSTKTLILHIGYPKTGTTTLQQFLFPHLPTTEYLGKYVAANPFGADWIDEFRMTINHGSFSNVKVSSAALSRQILKTFEESQSGRVLISLEGFANPFVDTRYVASKDIYEKANHLAMVLEQVAKQDVSIRILVTTRNQVNLIPSFFAQAFIQGFVSGLYGRTYDDMLKFMFEDNYLGIGHCFKFDKLGEHYRSLFGSESTGVFASESILQGEPAAAVDGFSAMLDCSSEDLRSHLSGKKANVRRSNKAANSGYKMMTGSPAAERMRAITGVPIRMAAFGIRDRLRMLLRKDVSWSVPDRSDLIRSYYEESNTRLLKLFDIDYLNQKP